MKARLKSYLISKGPSVMKLRVGVGVRKLSKHIYLDCMQAAAACSSSFKCAGADLNPREPVSI